MQLNDHGGLACSGWAFALAATLTALWALAPLLALAGRGGVRGLGRSLFGFLWLGFGVDFVGRFFLLLWDSVEFGNDTYRLADLPAAVVDRSLLLALGYWGAAVLGFALWRRSRRPGPLAAVEALGARGRADHQTALLVGFTACLLVAEGSGRVPLALVTPLSIVGRLWVFPAAFTWAAHHERGGRRGDSRRWLVLVPAVLHFAVSPYREHLVALLLLPLLTGLCVRGRMPRGWVVAVAAGVLCFTLASSFTQAYREVLWEGKPLGHLVHGDAGEDDEQDAGDAGWVLALRRFHGLDSLLLTVDLVPLVYPFTHEHVLLDGLVRGTVPRLLLPGKPASDRGPEFARTIWGYHDQVESEAAIAPSMAGDLYRAGGALMVLVGGLVWGLLLGLVDRWMAALSPAAHAAMLVLLATQVLPSVERDFAHATAAFLQTLVVLVVVGGAVGRVWGRRPAGAVACEGALP